MVPIRDLSVCDNWRGISLLDIGGKLSTKTIQSRLQDVVEEVLLDSVWAPARKRLCGYDFLLRLDGGEVECVTEFKYLGSIVEAKGGIAQEVGERIAKTSKALCALWEPIFRDSSLSLRTKRNMYKAVVLGVLLYGSETWTTKRDAVRRLEVFHNRCLKRILGITTAQQ